MYFDLRYYQERLKAGAYKQWETHRSTAIISATATGKTEIYLDVAVSEPKRVLVLAHRGYLLTQPIERLGRVGFDSVAVEKGDERSEGTYRKAKIVFASVSSVGPKGQRHRLESFDPDEFSLVIVDEGHRGTAVSYRNVYDHFAKNPLCKFLFMTATPKRKDGVALGTVCDSVAGVYGPAQAMAEGWIPPVKFYRRDVASLDFSKVRLKGSDLDEDQVQSLLMQEKPLHEVCASLAEDRGQTIVFCPKVDIASAYANLMNSRYRPGRAAVLHGESPDEERELVCKKLAEGELDYVFNVGLFTEGLDIPSLLRVVFAAPTASLVKYVQAVGRVFRPHDSLRGQLVGGVEDSEHRRHLIATSPKPFGVVVTYYPQNCEHELCDPVDILGGDDLPADAKRYAKQVQEETSKQGGGSKTEEDIETAKAFCDLKAVADRRRRELKAQAEFADRQFDPMSGRQAVGGGSRPAGERPVVAWPAGERDRPASDGQVRLLRTRRVPTPEGLTSFQASVVLDLVLKYGVQPETAASYPKRQALSVRDSCRAKQEASA